VNRPFGSREPEPRIAGAFWRTGCRREAENRIARIEKPNLCNPNELVLSINRLQQAKPASHHSPQWRIFPGSAAAKTA